MPRLTRALESSERPRRSAATRLTGKVYAYSFLNDLILLYPLYALLFADTGLSTAQISSLFIIWSAASIAVEIPSGVVADLVSRRLLLVIAPLLAGMGYALWVAVPSYPAFAVGFVLWGAGGALQSGAFEALLYEELDRLGVVDRYAQVIGRSTAAGTVAIVVAMAAAGPAFAVGGYAVLGVASVLACVAAAAVALRLPEHRDARPAVVVPAGGVMAPRAAEPVDDRANQPVDSGFAATLRAGVDEVRTSRRVLTAVLLVVVITAIWGALDEYVGLLARDVGVATEHIPAVLLAVYVGVAAGGLLGGAASRLPQGAVAGLLGLGALTLAVGALAGVPVGLLLIGVAFCAFQAVEIVADARLQHAITGNARSTITSVAGFGTDIATICVYVVYGAASTMAGHGAIFAGWAVVYAGLAVVIGRRALRRRRASRAEARPDR